MKKNNLIIAVSGKMRHGKDTIGDYLISKYGFKALRFADKVKEICMAYDNSTPELRRHWNEKVAHEVLDNKLKASQVDQLMQKICPGTWEKMSYDECYITKPEKVRLRMQGFAQGMRDIDPDCWVRCALNKAGKEQRRWVITDLRYRNEAFAIDASDNVQIWRVTRPIADETGANHISEIDLDAYPFEVFINNDGTIEQLYRKVDKLTKQLLRGSRPQSNGEDVY